MCGRFTNKADRKEIESEFDVRVRNDVEISKSYNIAPSQYVGAILCEDDGNRQFAKFKWGLIPSWAKDSSFASKMINARSETLAEKPSFREAYQKRRCLIPASGFYEWEKTKSGKQPHYFFLKDKEVFGFGGLWEEWLDKETGELIETCTIITTRANSLLEQVHERMPMIIKNADYTNWLDTRKFLANSESDNYFNPFPADRMDSYKVSKAVNSPTNNEAGLINPLNSK